MCQILNNYHLHMWEGNVFILSECVCVCVYVCGSVQAITFECLDIETSFLAWWYMLTISRSSLSTKVIGQGQGHYCKIDCSDCQTSNCHNQLRVFVWSSTSRSFQGQSHFCCITMAYHRIYISTSGCLSK